MIRKKSGELVLNPHNLEEMASSFTYRRSQPDSNKPVLPHDTQVWLVRMQAVCTASLQLYSTQRSPKVSATAKRARLILTHEVAIHPLLCSNGSMITYLPLKLQAQPVTQCASAAWGGSETSTPTSTWSYKVRTAARRRPAHQAGAEQAFQSAFSSELKTCFVRSRKRGGSSDRFNGKPEQVAFTLFASALRNDQKLTFQHEEAEMQVICHYPLQSQISLKQAVERMFC